MPEYSEEQKAKRISHFRRIIKYRIWFGWIFAFVGLSLFAVGLRGDQIEWLVVVNGLSFFGLWVVYGQTGKESLVEVKPIYNPLEARQSGVLPFLRVKQPGVGWIVFREVDSHPQESQTVLGCLRSEFPDLFEKTFCRAPLQFIRFLDPDIDQVTGYTDIHPWYSHQSR